MKLGCVFMALFFILSAWLHGKGTYGQNDWKKFQNHFVFKFDSFECWRPLFFSPAMCLFPLIFADLEVPQKVFQNIWLSRFAYKEALSRVFIKRWYLPYSGDVDACGQQETPAGYGQLYRRPWGDPNCRITFAPNGTVVCVHVPPRHSCMRTCPS